MKVKILKSSKPTYWYVNRIGEVFEVYDKIIPRHKYKYGVIPRRYELKNGMGTIDVDDTERRKEKVIFT